MGPLEHYHKWIGPPLLRSFEVYANATPEEAQTLLGYYRERFSSVGLFENEVYPGIPELLRDLKEHGARLAVATGKPTVFSRQILEHFGLHRTRSRLRSIQRKGDAIKCPATTATGS